MAVNCQFFHPTATWFTSCSTSLLSIGTSVSSKCTRNPMGLGLLFHAHIVSAVSVYWGGLSISRYAFPENKSADHMDRGSHHNAWFRSSTGARSRHVRPSPPALRGADRHARQQQGQLGRVDFPGLAVRHRLQGLKRPGFQPLVPYREFVLFPGQDLTRSRR